MENGELGQDKGKQKEDKQTNNFSGQFSSGGGKQFVGNNFNSGGGSMSF
jgi:hypothetical protein